jgi:hypothetical protein
MTDQVIFRERPTLPYYSINIKFTSKMLKMLFFKQRFDFYILELLKKLF